MKNKIKTIIVDDEQEGIEILSNLLENQSDIHIVERCSNADQAIEAIINHLPELVFLDIQMPVKSGFDVIFEMKNLQISHPKVIFTTAYDKYAIQAVKIAAFDYLLKPIDEDELNFTLKRLKTSILKSNFVNSIETLCQNIEKLKEPKLKFNSRNGFIVVDIDEIFYFEAEGNYTTIIFSNEKKEVLSGNIGQIFNILPKDKFYKVNRSYIINIDYLKTVNRKNKICTIEKDSFKVNLSIVSEAIRELERRFSSSSF